MKKYIKNISWLALGEAFKYILSLFVSILVVRYLGAEKVGIIEYALGFLAIISVFSNFGTDGYVIRDLSSSNYLKNDILGTSFIFRIAGFFICLIILIVNYIYFFDNPLIQLVIFLFAIPLLLKSFQVINFYFQSRVLSKYVVFSTSISLIIISTIKALLVIWKAPFIFFIYSAVLDSVIVTICLILFYKKRSGQNILDWNFNLEYAKKFIKNSFPILIGTLAYTIFLKIDVIMIKSMLGLEELGIYSIATRLINMWYVLPMMITTSVFPALVNAKRHSKELYLLRLQQWFDFSALLGWAISLFMIASATIIIPLLYGSEFLPSIPILRIYSITGLFLCISFPVGKYLLIEEYYTIPFIRYSIAALINVLGNYFLIPIYGIIGAAYASVFSTFIAFYGGNLMFRKTTKIFIMQTKSLLFLNLRKSTIELINDYKRQVRN